MKIGLVLEGGAMRGMFTAGVLDIFSDHNIPVDGIIGVSAGALFGVNYPSKQRGRVLRYNKEFCRDKNYMGFSSLLRTGNIINKDFAYYEVPTNRDIFDDKAFQESNTDFYAVVTNIHSGKAEYIKIKSVFEQMEALRASSAMPYVSKTIELDGKLYLDGGIADSIPIEKCMELGYDKIIVVLTRPLGYRKSPSNATLSKLMYRKYKNLTDALIHRYEHYNHTLEKIAELEKSKEIFVIRPSKTVDIKRVERNPEKLQEMYDLGIEDGNSIISDLKAYLEV